ncbi:hypothetical protein PENSPDRAFT_748166 [Peniophora sp. CONT]|nr:hypothetical protein PENSPDRAFT_748166 [Peniophora sp. CONT]
MRTPFLVIRFVILALVGYLSVVALALAAWNIAAAKAAGTYAPSGAIFLIFNACFYLVLIALAFLEYVGQGVNEVASLVITECVWSGLMAILSLAASITATIGGPPMFCHDHVPFSLCASATVIVPVSWLAGILMLSYFLTILGLSIGHMHTEPGIWFKSLYSIPWFESDRVSKYPPVLPPVNRHESARLSFLARRHSLSVFPEDLERSAGEDSAERPSAPEPKTPTSLFKTIPLYKRTDSSDANRPWWARVKDVRPGIDMPFPRVLRFSALSLSRTPRGSADRGQPPVPALPEQDEGVDDFGQRYMSFFPGERRPSQRVPDSASAGHLIYDPDRPLPRPPRSQWVRADGTSDPGRSRYPKPF